MPVDDLIMLPSGIVECEDECPAEGIPSGTRRHFSVGNGRDACVVMFTEIVCSVVSAAIRIGIDAIPHYVPLAPRLALALRVGFPIFIRLGFDSESFVLHEFNA